MHVRQGRKAYGATHLVIFLRRLGQWLLCRRGHVVGAALHVSNITRGMSWLQEATRHLLGRVVVAGLCCRALAAAITVVAVAAREHMRKLWRLQEDQKDGTELTETGSHKHTCRWRSTL